MVTDGLETNQPGSRDLCPGTSCPFKYVCVYVLIYACVGVGGCVSHELLCIYVHVSLQYVLICLPISLRG